jgi:GTP pyrophosphokinase
MDYAASILAKIPGTSSRRGRGLRQLFETLDSYMPADHIEQVLHAYEFGATAHQGQTRLSGEPFISHPIAVAKELADMHMDAQTIAAAILHDVVEDTSTTLDDIEEQFGQEITALVDGVSKLDQIRFHSRAEAQAESFRKMMLAMIEDIRVILVKLADRLHNMQTLDAMPREKQARIARETVEIYAPIANRLGINHMKVDLEELGFRYLYPFRHRVLKNTLKKSKGNQRQIVKKISEGLQKALEAEGIAGEVVGREKHLYSIYKKMTEKKRLLSDVVDVVFALSSMTSIPVTRCWVSCTDCINPCRVDSKTT